MPIGTLDPRLAELGLSVNGQLTDRAIRHAVFLEQYKNKLTKDALEFMQNDVHPELIERLEHVLRGKGGWSKRVAAQTMLAHEAMLKEGMATLSMKTTGSLKELALSEAAWQQGALRNLLPLDIDTKAPSPALLRAIVERKPMDGRLIKDWFKGIPAPAAAGIRKQVDIGIAAGKSIDDIVRGVKGLPNLPFSGSVGKINHQVRSLVRTSVNHTTTQAKEASYAANTDVIKAVQIVATLDSRTTEICMGQDGRIYPVGEGPRPPFHFQCRTTTVPVTKSWKEMGVPLPKDQGAASSVRASMNGEVAGRTTYGKWLRKQTPEFQDRALGTAKGKLFREGKIAIEDFASFTKHAGFKTLSVAQLELLEEEVEFVARAAVLSPAAKVSLITDLIDELNNATDPLQKKNLRSKLRKLDKDWKTKYTGTVKPKAPPPPIVTTVLEEDLDLPPESGSDFLVKEPTPKEKKALIELGHEKLDKKVAPGGGEYGTSIHKFGFEDNWNWDKVEKVWGEEFAENFNDAGWSLDKKEIAQNGIFIRGDALKGMDMAGNSQIPKHSVASAILHPAEEAVMVARLPNGKFVVIRGQGTAAVAASINAPVKVSFYRVTGSGRIVPAPDLLDELANMKSPKGKPLPKTKSPPKGKTPPKTLEPLPKTPTPGKAPPVFSGEDVIDTNDMIPTGRKSPGSNPGEFFRDKNGDEWLVKRPPSVDHVNNEVLGSKLYEAAGIDAPTNMKASWNGQPAVASKIIPGLNQVNGAKLYELGAGDGFAVDAWLGNWDAVGLSLDNMLSSGGKVYRVDTGGTLLYRAQGGAKGAKFGHVVGEIDTMRNGFNPAASSVFGHMTDAELIKSIDRVLDIPDSAIRNLVNTYGPANAKTRADLTNTLIARKINLKAQQILLQEKVKKAAADAIEAEKVAKQMGKKYGAKKETRAIFKKRGDNMFQAAWDRWKQSLTAVESDAVRSWTQSGYVAMRKYQREGIGAASVAQKVRNMDAAFGRAPLLEVKGYRGVNVPNELAAQWAKPGTIITQNSHDSWSTRLTVAESFSGSGYGPNTSVIFEVKNKRGIDVKQLSSHRSEDEFISELGTQLRVVGVRDGSVVNRYFKGPNASKRIILECEEVGISDQKLTHATVRRRGKKGPKAELIQDAPDLKTIRSIVRNHKNIGTAGGGKVSIKLGNIGLDSAKVITTQLVEIADEMPSVLRHISVIESVDNLADDTFAVFVKPSTPGGLGKLQFNAKKFKDINKLEATLAAQGDSKWLAGNSVDHVIKHEVGHAFDKFNREITQPVLDWIDQHAVNKQHLSQYATTNKWEAFAEAFAVVTTQPQTAWSWWVKEFAQQLGESMTKQGLPLPVYLTGGS